MQTSVEGPSSIRTARSTAIFVVDDEPLLLELAEAVLESLGYTVATFDDPAATLTAFTRSKPYPKVLVTDFSMHTMSGTELMNACRKMNPELKTLILSGTVCEEVPVDGTRPAEMFLHKPYRTEELVRCVEALLTQR